MEFEAKKSLGQNFLKNPQIAARIAKTAEIAKGEVVFEVGPGTGALTRELLKEGAKMVALEADERAVAVLEESLKGEIASGRLVLIHGDIRETPVIDLPLPKTYKVAANIPYYLSGMLFKLFLTSEKQPNSLVFLVQKEVAERIARSPKESMLSLSIKAYGTPIYEGAVARGNFEPMPNVDSAILKVANISKDRFFDLEEASFFKVLKAGFSARRKQLRGNLADLAPKAEIEAAFLDLDIPLDARGEDLPIDKWVALATRLTA
jgi:16S rRNA (adenine1518-N6/adenine1519-N6)-dimethyltransferase